MFLFHPDSAFSRTFVLLPHSFNADYENVYGWVKQKLLTFVYNEKLKEAIALIMQHTTRDTAYPGYQFKNAVNQSRASTALHDWRTRAKIAVRCKSPTEHKHLWTPYFLLLLRTSYFGNKIEISLKKNLSIYRRSAVP